MFAFVFSDLHASYKQLNNLRKFLAGNQDIELLIFAGDLVNMGEPVDLADDFLEIIESISLPLMWVPGNNDFGRSYQKLNAKIKSLEGRVVQFGGYRFTGVGGSPASWEGQYAGETSTDKIEIAGSVFVSHVPPPGLLNMQKFDCNSPTAWSHSGSSPESTNLDPRVKPKDDRPIGRRFSDSPLVHICGHQHSQWGCGYLGTTKVINPGPLAEGRYAILDLESLKVKFCHFNL